MILHVLPTGVPKRLFEEIEADAKRKLEQAVGLARKEAANIGRADVEITSELAAGQAFVEIIRRSRIADCDLIVLGRHGRRPIRDRFIGTTAERVIHKGDVPVLVVHAEPQGPYRRPLMGTDLQDASTRILELTLRVLDPEVRRIAVVHAFHMPFESWLGRGHSEAATDYRRQIKDEAAAGLNKLMASWKDAGVEFTPILSKSEPRTAVLSEAVRRRADLVVVGTHAKSGVARVLVGSVADWIIKAAVCDVLVGRPVRFSFELP